MAADWTWLINFGVGPQFHALPAERDPGPAPHVNGLFDVRRWPTVDSTAACGVTGTFRRGGYIHDGLGRCLGCCDATGIARGYGAPAIEEA